MDNYFDTSHECIGCGACVYACSFFGYNALYLCKSSYDEDKYFVVADNDSLHCHHCDGFCEDNAPCQAFCPKDSVITIERYQNPFIIS